MDSAIDGYFGDFKAVLENTKKCAARTNAMEREGDDLVTRLTKLLAILLVLILSFHQVIAAEAAGPFSKDALSIPSLDENTAIYAGTWVADSEEQAFLLLGNEKVMWLAVATQMEDGAYQLIAQSKPVLSYEKYCLGSVEMMDKWDDGRPYFWYCVGNYINYYLLASDAGDGTPFVRSLFVGHTQGSNAVTSTGGFLPHMKGQYLYLDGWFKIQQVTDANNTIVSGMVASSGNTSTPVVTMNEIELSGEVQLSSLGVQIFPRMR